MIIAKDDDLGNQLLSYITDYKIGVISLTYIVIIFIMIVLLIDILDTTNPGVHIPKVHIQVCVSSTLRM